ncbi:MAG: sigma-70 family RNA polymerase sigma factor [Chloroflexota bacterium]
MNANAGAVFPNLSVSLQDMVMDGLAGLRSRAAREATVAMPSATGKTATRRNGLLAGTGRAATGQRVEEKTAVMTSDSAENTHSALSSQPLALTSAEQDRLSVQAALRGDQAAFGDLVNRYQTAVYNMAYRMLGDPTEAEDAAQEVFVRAWNQLHTFQQDRRFSTWLLSIASHHAIDMLRRRKPSAPLDDVALYIESNEPQPDEIALQGEQRDIVKKLLNTLPEKYRSVTVLRYYNDLSYDEIARMTGLTESAVKTQLHRARRMLAEQFVAAGEAGGRTLEK